MTSQGGGKGGQTIRNVVLKESIDREEDKLPISVTKVTGNNAGVSEMQYSKMLSTYGLTVALIPFECRTGHHFVLVQSVPGQPLSFDVRWYGNMFRWSSPQ